MSDMGYSHGTYFPSAHTYMKMGCRCDECRAAYADAQARSAATRRGKPRNTRHNKRRRVLLDGADACLSLVGDPYYDDKPDMRQRLAQAAVLMREEATKRTSARTGNQKGDAA